MSAQTAKIIDFQERRAARQRERTMNAAGNALLQMPPMVAMTWVPVWFVPVFFAGSPAQFG
jgi:hypothetical protein